MISARTEQAAASAVRDGLLAGAATVPLSVIGSTSALGQQYIPYSYGRHMWDGGWSMFFGPIWGLLFLGILIVLIVLVVRWMSTSSPSGTSGAPKTPLDILRERYARGEIDKDEFEERKRILGA